MTRTWHATALLLALIAAPALAAESGTEGPVESVSLAEATVVVALAPVPPDTFRMTVTADALQRGTMLPALYAGLVGLQVYDGASTLYALERGAREANPLMRHAVTHPAMLFGVKTGLAAGTIYMSERLWKRNRRVAAVALMVASTVLYSAVAFNNTRVLRTLR